MLIPQAEYAKKLRHLLPVEAFVPDPRKLGKRYAVCLCVFNDGSLSLPPLPPHLPNREVLSTQLH